MGKVQASTEAGVGLGYGPVMLVARQSLGERGHRGAQADLSIDFPWSLSDRLFLRFALGATWADRDFMQAHFGVTAAQARATPFSVYAPKSGVRKFDASVGGEYGIAPSWKLQANVGFSQLGDDAAASPLVGRRHGASAALAVACEF
jgi:MipA family protein